MRRLKSGRSKAPISRPSPKSAPLPPPTETCARCGRTLSETGGQRLLIPRLWTKNEIQGAGGPVKIVREMHEGKRNPEVVQEAPAGWSAEDLAKVKAAELSAKKGGRTAWVCQPCLNRTCRKCRAPLVCPPCSDVLHEDGNVSHAFYMGELAGCTNSACPSRRATR